jgi:hypothetical protein
VPADLVTLNTIDAPQKTQPKKSKFLTNFPYVDWTLVNFRNSTTDHKLTSKFQNFSLIITPAPMVFSVDNSTNTEQGVANGN